MVIVLGIVNIIVICFLLSVPISIIFGALSAGETNYYKNKKWWDWPLSFLINTIGFYVCPIIYAGNKIKYITKYVLCEHR